MNARLLAGGLGAGLASGGLLWLARRRVEDMRMAEAMPGAERVMTVGGVGIYKVGNALVFECGATVNADGSPNAYGPPSRPGIDYLANAGGPGNWYGVVTDDGTKSGNPVVQGPSDPSPGRYVSATALSNPAYPRTNPRRYVDAEKVPFAALPPELAKLAPVGSLVKMERNGRSVWGLVADVGPRGKVGELSVAAAAALGIPSSPKSGGVSSGVRYTVYFDTADRSRASASAAELASAGAAHLRSLGAAAAVAVGGRYWWVEDLEACQGSALSALAGAREDEEKP